MSRKARVDERLETVLPGLCFGVVISNSHQCIFFTERFPVFHHQNQTINIGVNHDAQIILAFLYHFRKPFDVFRKAALIVWGIVRWVAVKFFTPSRPKPLVISVQQCHPLSSPHRQQFKLCLSDWLHINQTIFKNQLDVFIDVIFFGFILPSLSTDAKSNASCSASLNTLHRFCRDKFTQLVEVLKHSIEWDYGFAVKWSRHRHAQGNR